MRESRKPAEVSERSMEVCEGFLDSSMTRIERFQVVERDKPSSSFSSPLCLRESQAHELVGKNLKKKVFDSPVISRVYCSISMTWSHLVTDFSLLSTNANLKLVSAQVRVGANFCPYRCP
eukprot:scaffold35032_cov72-Cyclotella_meneghiniana.AAC.1